jgi:hypothetical protein
MKKMKKVGSYLSMENLGDDNDEDEELSNDDSETNAVGRKQSQLSVEKNELRLDSENVVLYPIYVLE